MSVNCPQGQQYVINAGDTYFNLARRFGINVNDIIQANPDVDPDALVIGQVICIPVPVTPSPCSGMMYTIRSGDTFYTIARRSNVSLDQLLAANPNVDPDQLQVGQQICIPGITPPSTCPNGTLYTIQAGDTFFGLAQRYNITVASIQAANPGVNPNTLRIGQKICIPVTPPVACAGGFLYTIKTGDTYFALAQRYGTTVAAITSANPGVNPNTLRVGQQICIPVSPTRPCPDGFFYTVQAGDTFFALAQRYNITVTQLSEANPGVDPDRLQIGQQLCIPGVPQPT